MHPDILTTDVWVTIGFTYNTYEQKYCLIKQSDDLCLACMKRLEPKINTFCYECKAPTPPDWTTGNKSLDSFIMESWNNVKNKNDSYIQWIEYSLLTGVQEMSSLSRGCTLLANWLEPTANEWIKVTLKKTVDDFHQVNYFTICVTYT